MLYDSKKLRFIQNQEVSGILSNFGLKTHLYRMNELINKFLLPGDESMFEMYLRQPGFTYGACGPFTKNKGRIQKFKETGDSRYNY